MSLSPGARVVAIVGGARGTGRAIGDLDYDAAHSTARILGSSVVAYQLDATQRTSFEVFLAAIERDLGPVDVVIDTVGLSPATDLADNGPEQIADVFVRALDRPRWPWLTATRRRAGNDRTGPPCATRARSGTS